MSLAFLSTLFGAVSARGAPEQPGDRSNPRLAQLVAQSLEDQLHGMRPEVQHLIAAAPTHAKAWLREIAQVVARCRGGPSDQSKLNLLEYDVTLASGEKLESVYTGHRCVYVGTLRPMVMRVVFDNGVATEAFTDGRELALSVDSAKVECDLMARSLLKIDRMRRPERYFVPGPSAAQIEEQWKPR
ncbi:MAG: hypothetical protein ABIW85_07240 [Variovorax sp.]